MSIVLSPDEILDIINNDKNCVIVDVRSSYEFKTNHFIGAINIPILTLHSITSRVLNKNTNIFLYCSSGLISEDGKKMLRKLGYKNVYNMGGIYHYTEHLYIE